MRFVEAKVPVLIFQEGEKIIAYSPALDLSTYGNTEKQAKQRFDEAVSIFFAECLKMGTLDEVLEECGWQKLTDGRHWLPPAFKSYKEESIQIPV